MYFLFAHLIICDWSITVFALFLFCHPPNNTVDIEREPVTWLFGYPTPEPNPVWDSAFAGYTKWEVCAMVVPFVSLGGLACSAVVLALAACTVKSGSAPEKRHGYCANAALAAFTVVAWIVMFCVSLWGVVHGITGLADTSGEEYFLSNGALYWIAPAPVLFGFSVVLLVVLVAMCVLSWWVASEYK